MLIPRQMFIPRQQPVGALWHKDYPTKPASFALSIMAHAGLILFTWFVPSLPVVQKATAPQRIVEPKDTRLIWYQLKKKLPAVTPTRRIGAGDRPRGLERTLQQPIIAESPQPASKEQFVWHEAPKLNLEQDLRAPNLITRRPRAPLKAFTPPPAPRNEAAQGVPLTEAPPIDRAPALPTVAGLPGALARPQPRAFVPPTASSGEQGGASPVLALDSSAPSVQSGALATADLAIVGLRPADRLEGPPPQGSRPGSFSRAADLGVPSSGAGVASGIQVPDLMIGPGKGPSGAVGSTARSEKGAPGERSTELIYNQMLLGGTRPALSAPLRPGARTLPRAIEARFPNRVVYTIVIPVPQLPDYMGDWVLWFVELEPQPGETPRMQAPLPTRKVDVLRSKGAVVEGALMISAVIRMDGRLERLKVVRGNPALEQSATNDLKKWDFRPAFRDGVAVDVEVVFDIPFRLPAQ